MAHYEEIEIDQGADVAIEVHLINSTTQLAKDLTNHSVYAKMKKSYNSDSADSLDFTAIIAVPETSGIINLTLTNAQTDTLKSGRYLYDAEIHYLDSDSQLIVERVIEGRITVTPSITR
jgi:hypothetical protein